MLRLLFQVDVGGCPPGEALALASETAHYDQETLAFAGELMEGVLAHRDAVDEAIVRYAREWTLSRMANVDRNILRLAAYEILYREDIPVNVSINEAVELADKYSTEDSGKFINGVLGSLARAVEASAGVAPERVECHD